MAMSELATPIVSVVIGEGGSGGALAIGVTDKLYILEYSTYSVISPEGCASILWKSADKADVAAESMGITAKRLKEVGVADEIIKEPLGGAHRDYDAIASSIKKELLETIDELQRMEVDQLLARRYDKLRSYGYYK